MVEPPLTIIREVKVLWKRPKVDFAELAHKRWIENWSLKELASYYDRSPITIEQYLRKLRIRVVPSTSPTSSKGV